MQRNVKRKERNRDAEQGMLKSIAKKLADFVGKNPKEIRKNPKEGGKEGRPFWLKWKIKHGKSYYGN